MDNFSLKAFVILLTLTIIIGCSIGGQYGKDHSVKDKLNPTDTNIEMHNFMPWPPPKPTSFYPFPLRRLIESNKFHTLGDVNDYVVEKLISGNPRYGQIGYYKAPEGFAIVMPYEEIAEDGKPIEETSKNQPIFGKLNDLKKLIFKQYGYIRIVVFIVTTDMTGSDSEGVPLSVAERWISDASKGLSGEIRKLPVKKDKHIAYFNIYEFKKPKGEEAMLLENSLNPANVELKLSGIDVENFN